MQTMETLRVLLSSLSFFPRLGAVSREGSGRTLVAGGLASDQEGQSSCSEALVQGFVHDPWYPLAVRRASSVLPCHDKSLDTQETLRISVRDT